jgi:hypothetical protein
MPPIALKVIAGAGCRIISGGKKFNCSFVYAFDSKQFTHGIAV